MGLTGMGNLWPGQTQGDAEVAHRITSLAHLGSIGIDLGRKLKRGPAKEQVIGNAEANQRLRSKLAS